MEGQENFSWLVLGAVIFALVLVFIYVYFFDGTLGGSGNGRHSMPPLFRLK